MPSDELGMVDDAAPVPATGEPVLVAQNLAKWYGDVIALNDITVDVGPGITGLLGPNGAGKSTLMKLSVGLLRPSAGKVTVLGQRPWGNPRLLRRIGYVLEGDAPWRSATGRQAARYSAELAGLSGRDADAAVEDALRKVDLADQGDKPVGAYSRGMRQKLKFAFSLLADPDLYILDEPLLGVDPITRRHLVDLIKDLARRGKSVILSTHVLPDVESMTSRICLINRGRLMAYGDVAHIRDVLERYPRTIRIATPDPQKLGASLWGWPSILSLQAEPAAVVIKTPKPAEFYAQLQEHLTNGEHPFTSIVPVDDSLEAIFEYLVR